MLLTKLNHVKYNHQRLNFLAFQLQLVDYKSKFKNVKDKSRGKKSNYTKEKITCHGSVRGGFTMGSLGSGEPGDFWKKIAQFFF